MPATKSTENAVKEPILCAAMTPTASPGSAKVVLRCNWLSGLRGDFVKTGVLERYFWRFFFGGLGTFRVLNLRKGTEVDELSCIAKTHSVCILYNSFWLAHQHLYVYVYLAEQDMKHHIQWYIDGYSNVFNDASPT